jgi:heptaprenyl diphosphate synthase
MTDFWKDTPHLEKLLAEVESIIVANLNDPGYPLAAQTSALIVSGGKMLRPAMVLMASGFGPTGKNSQTRRKIAHIAAAVEILHTATLIHDDILDEADVRRGIPSLHTKFGTANAILAGDWLFARSFRLVADYAQQKSARVLARFVESVCSAEIRQDLGKFSFSTTRRDYLRTIAGKTAALFSLALHVGAAEAKVPAIVTQRLRRAGYDIGMAFQIIDDILDCESDDLTLKKPTGNDLKEGLCTLPLVYALEDAATAKKIKPYLLARPIGDEEAGKILKIVNACGALEKARTAARQFTARARKEIAALPPCPARDELATLTEKLLTRTY